MSDPKTDKPPSLPRNLRRALTKHDPPLTQTELARVTGIHPAEISRIVGRGMKPTETQRRKLLEVLAPPTDGPVEA